MEEREEAAPAPAAAAGVNDNTGVNDDTALALATVLKQAMSIGKDAAEAAGKAAEAADKASETAGKASEAADKAAETAGKASETAGKAAEAAGKALKIGEDNERDIKDLKRLQEEDRAEIQGTAKKTADLDERVRRLEAVTPKKLLMEPATSNIPAATRAAAGSSGGTMAATSTCSTGSLALLVEVPTTSAGGSTALGELLAREEKCPSAKNIEKYSGNHELNNKLRAHASGSAILAQADVAEVHGLTAALLYLLPYQWWVWRGCECTEERIKEFQCLAECRGEYTEHGFLSTSVTSMEDQRLDDSHGLPYCPSRAV